MNLGSALGYSAKNDLMELAKRPECRPQELADAGTMTVSANLGFLCVRLKSRLTHQNKPPTYHRYRPIRHRVTRTGANHRNQQRSRFNSPLVPATKVKENLATTMGVQLVDMI
jgi:hypothetical protein